MKVQELVDNKEFDFNVPFRVVEYTPTEEDPDHVDILWDCMEGGRCPPEVGRRYISAVNVDDIRQMIEIESYTTDLY